MNSAVDIGPDRAGWTGGLLRTRRRLGAVAALRLALMGTLALGFAWMGLGGAGRAWAGPAEVGLDGAVTGGADACSRNPRPGIAPPAHAANSTATPIPLRNFRMASPPRF